MPEIKIIHVTFDNVAWAVEVSGRSYDEILDALNTAHQNGYVCTIECLSNY